MKARRSQVAQIRQTDKRTGTVYVYEAEAK